MAYFQLHDGRRLWYEEEGQGQPVVFLHGWKASANVYAAPSRLLAEEYRCIRYDQCGHQRSDVPPCGPDLGVLAEDLRELLVGMKLEKPILVGWSMGGMVMLEYLRRYGSTELGKLVFVDIAPVRMKDPEELARELTLARINFHEFMRKYYTTRIPGFARLSADEQDSEILRKLRGHNPAVLTNLWASFSRRDHRDVLPAVTCPTAVFYAGIMPGCNEEMAQYYRAAIPAPTRLVCFENCSHSLLLEEPTRFAEELRSFFAQA